MSRSWSGSPRSMSPRRRGWWAPVRPTRPRWASGSPRSGRWTRRPMRSWSWPSSWSTRASSGSWSSRRPTTGGHLCTCWRPGGWWCGWSMPATPEHLPGRPKTDKLDSVWLAKLTERGRLRPSFVPPAEIRQLRDDTRLRLDLTRDRSRHVQRIEQAAGRRPDQALHRRHRHHGQIRPGDAGGADRRPACPKALADLARGRLRGKHAALVQALTGRFDDHHAELARMLLDQYDALTAQIDRLTARIEALIAAIPAAQGVDADGTTGPGAGTGPDAAVLPAIWRLD